jgi:hypothetical protein
VLGLMSFLATLYALRAWGFALNGNLGRIVLRLNLARREGAR